MNANSNAWRRINYTLWSPCYDTLARVFNAQRRRSIAGLALQPGERVLIVGAGTGLDVPFLPDGPQYLAVDLTPAMLARLDRRARRLGRSVASRTMDAMALDLPDAAFDAVILHLILAVVPDPMRCLAEVARVLRPGGRAAILDKFAPDGPRVPLALRLLNPLLSVLGTNVDRQLSPLLAGGPWTVEADEGFGPGGFYRLVRVRRTAGPLTG